MTKMIFDYPFIQRLVLGLAVMCITACSAFTVLFQPTHMGQHSIPENALAPAAEAEPTLVPLLTGNASQGKIIFSTACGDAPSCSSCHAVLAGGFRRGGAVAPNLSGISQRAELRIPGLSAEEYLHTSIVTPSRYLVEGYLDQMYQGYADIFSAQDIADLIAYLLTL